jgi:hypothetical protein
MSNPELPSNADEDEDGGASNADEDEDGGASKGPSLTLIYSLVALALAAAIGFALLIVLPFYHRR